MQLALRSLKQEAYEFQAAWDTYWIMRFYVKEEEEKSKATTKILGKKYNELEFLDFITEFRTKKMEKDYQRETHTLEYSNNLFTFKQRSSAYHMI